MASPRKSRRKSARPARRRRRRRAPAEAEHQPARPAADDAARVDICWVASFRPSQAAAPGHKYWPTHFDQPLLALSREQSDEGDDHDRRATSMPRIASIP